MNGKLEDGTTCNETFKGHFSINAAMSYEAPSPRGILPGPKVHCLKGEGNGTIRSATSAHCEDRRFNDSFENDYENRYTMRPTTIVTQSPSNESLYEYVASDTDLHTINECGEENIYEYPDIDQAKGRPTGTDQDIYECPDIDQAKGRPTGTDQDIYECPDIDQAKGKPTGTDQDIGCLDNVIESYPSTDQTATEIYENI